MVYYRMKLGWLVVVFAALALLFVSPGASMAQEGDEGVEIALYDMSGRQVGTAMLMDTEDGLMVEASVAGMDPVAGDHATMFHEVGICGMGADFGKNYGPIVQFLPNMQFYSNGSGSYAVTAADWTVDDLMDSDGSAYAIHADAGENIGPPIVCGVIPTGTGSPPPSPAPAPQPAPEPAPAPAPAPAPEPDDDDEPLTEEEYLTWLIENGVAADLFSFNDALVGYMEAVFDVGEMAIGVYLEGMDPVPGNHRMVIADEGSCEADSFDALYELPDLQLFASGVADYFQVVAGIEDASEILDADGSTLVIYADTGADTADVIACGSIMSMPDYLNMFGLTVQDYVDFILDLV